jgi:hypothetical protein
MGMLIDRLSGMLMLAMGTDMLMLMLIDMLPWS